MPFEPSPISVTQTPTDSGMAELQALLAQQAAAAAELRQSMMALSEASAKAGAGMGALTKGLIGWGVAAQAVGTGIVALTSVYMGQVAQMRIAQGKLSQGFAMQAQNRGAALTAIGAIPFVGGPAADFLHAWRNERSGSAVNIAVAGLLEGSYVQQRGISDQLSMSVASGALEQKYRYNPEMLDYQKNLLGLRPAEGNIRGMRRTLAERKANAATIRAEEGSFGATMKRGALGLAGAGFGAIGLVAGLVNYQASGERVSGAENLYKIAASQYGPKIASQGKQVEALKAQAYESYKQNFYGGMGTTSFADWRSSGISSATMGGPGADLLVSGVEMTNTLLAQIVDNTKGFNEMAGVRK